MNHNNEIELDEYVIMPNHFHGIIKIGLDSRMDVGMGTVWRADMKSVWRAGLGPAPIYG
ncbi:hypothetical protein K8S19_00515 [bacterium]|nr:hypothetical protein [bacterium]